MIDILLATYDSSRYLKEQIDSILAQDFPDWRLLIRDGGSSDGTRKIIDEYCRLWPGKILQVASAGPATAIENFSALLQAAQAPYAMFCDHDDVWLPRKISLCMERMKEAQAACGDGVPLLVYSDKTVVDADLRELAASYNREEGLRPERVCLSTLLIQNAPSGCTMLFNRALACLASPIPPEAVMHDYWVALVAACFGKIEYLDLPTMLYRQHAGNVLGVDSYGIATSWKKLRAGSPAERTGESLRERIAQARALIRAHGGSMSPSVLETVSAFCRLQELNWLMRRLLWLRFGFFKHGLIRNVGLLIFM
jgi:glycosyltransferase involved in cell wall biosynthesis